MLSVSLNKNHFLAHLDPWSCSVGCYERLRSGHFQRQVSGGGARRVGHLLDSVRQLLLRRVLVQPELVVCLGGKSDQANQHVVGSNGEVMHKFFNKGFLFLEICRPFATRWVEDKYNVSFFSNTTNGSYGKNIKSGKYIMGKKPPTRTRKYLPWLKLKYPWCIW